MRQTMDDRVSVHLIVNGEPVEALVGPQTTLLGYLRGVLCLRGAKNGCSTNHCGACTVLVDGKPARSCRLRLTSIESASVETIEGLARDGRLHPIQQAYVDAGAVQCGFCTPGMILATKALLDAHPAPTEPQIREWLKGNICRCTGYVKIIDAVKDAGRRLMPSDAAAGPGRASAGPGGDGSLALGTSAADWDGEAKVRGSLPFVDDLEPAGVIHGAVVWAAEPHAEIVKLDTSAAADAPGVVGILTAADVPGLNAMGIITADQPVLCRDRVRFVGDPVAVAFAETPEAARTAARLVAVEYRVLPGVFSPQAGLAAGAPRLHERGNICKHLAHETGDVATAMTKAALVVEGHFDTPAVEHAYLEPEGAIGAVADDGTVVVYAPTQFPFELRRQLAAVLAVDEDRVRVVVTPIGGGFGGKADHCVEALAALGAVCLGRPTKVVLEREESLRASTKRHAYSMDYRVALSAEGDLLGVDAKLLSDAGPYTSLSPRVIDQACIFACGPYRVPNVRLEGWAVNTNNANASAFRGFGINQAAVAMECLLDEAARTLGIDPFAIRLRNALAVGDRTVSGEILQVSVATQATLEATKQALQPELPWIQAARAAGRHVGVGVACGFKNVGAGKGKVDDAGAVLTLLPGGVVRLRASVVDMGQGIRTTMAQIAAQVLGLSARDLELVTGDTAQTIRHGGAAGERQTLIAGKAVELASREFAQLLLSKAAEYAGVDRDGLTLAGARVNGPGGSVLTLAQLAERAGERYESLETSYYYVAPTTYALADDEGRAAVPPEEYRNYPAYAYTTQAAIVEVDDTTSKVSVLKMLAAHDCGVAVNPQKIEGQIEGSCLQGIGYALAESYPQREGRPLVRTYGRLGVPTILDAPEVVCLIVEDPEPGGPFGAKGVSEVATVPATPAVLNAIRDAVGVRIHALPATPQVIAALRGRSGR